MAKRENNPWLANAAIGATGETYEIRTVADFLKVPEARRRICLREFHAWMVLQEGITDLMCAAGEALETPIPRDILHWNNEVYRWTDDGKATMTAQIQPIAKPSSDGICLVADSAVDPVGETGQAGLRATESLCSEALPVARAPQEAPTETDSK